MPPNYSLHPLHGSSLPIWPVTSRSLQRLCRAFQNLILIHSFHQGPDRFTLTHSICEDLLAQIPQIFFVSLLNFYSAVPRWWWFILLKSWDRLLFKRYTTSLISQDDVFPSPDGAQCVDSNCTAPVNRSQLVELNHFRLQILSVKWCQVGRQNIFSVMISGSHFMILEPFGIFSALKSRIHAMFFFDCRWSVQLLLSSGSINVLILALQFL